MAKMPLSKIRVSIINIPVMAKPSAYGYTNLLARGYYVTRIIQRPTMSPFFLTV
jgi:hypothetical protein